MEDMRIGHMELVGILKMFLHNVMGNHIEFMERQIEHLLLSLKLEKKFLLKTLEEIELMFLIQKIL